MENSKIQKVIGIMLIIFCLSRFLSLSRSGNPSYLIWGSLGIFILTLTFLPKNKYSVQIVLAITMGLIIFSGLILIYTYLFIPIYVSYFEYYLEIGIFIIYTFFFIFVYINKEDPNFLFGEN
jgi:hypothetical protein